MTFIPNDATGDALRQYIADGSDLTKPMKMDFFVAVPSRKAGDQVAAKAQKLGFEIKVDQDAESLEWTCYCTKTIIPEYSEVVSIEQKLDSIAKVIGGHIDGFGSFGNADIGP